MRQDDDGRLGNICGWIPIHSSYSFIMFKTFQVVILTKKHSKETKKRD